MSSSPWWLPAWQPCGSRRRRRSAPVPPTPPAPPPAFSTLEIRVSASSFMDDVRSAYDGAIGGTEASSFVAVPGRNAVPDRVFWFSQSDGAVQRGQNPANWFATLAGYTPVQVSLGPGMLDATTVATALAAAAAATGDYTVIVIGDVVRLVGDIDSSLAFFGPSFAGRGDAGLWGIRVAQVNTLPFGTFEGPAGSAANAQHAIAPANPFSRVIAMDVFIGSVHPIGDQLRLALFEGGTALSPVGAVLVYDFGQIDGVATNQWVRVWVAINDMAIVGSATNLWMVLKSNVDTTLIRNVAVGAGWNGNMTDEDFFITTMNPDATVAYPAVVPAGGAFSGFNVTLCMRIIYDSEPFAADGSWLRRFGSHLTNIAVGNEVPIDSQLYMGQSPPQAAGMELDYIDVPYGTVHVGQFRGGFWNGGVLVDATGTPIGFDFGQTSGAILNGYARINAPGPGPSAIAIDQSQPVWWGIKNDAVDAFVRFAFNGNPEIASPVDNPQDWLPSAGPGFGSEFEIFDPTPGMNPDPTVPWEAVVPAGGSLPGNFPFAALGFRINGMQLTAS